MFFSLLTLVSLQLLGRFATCRIFLRGFCLELMNSSFEELICFPNAGDAILNLFDILLKILFFALEDMIFVLDE